MTDTATCRHCHTLRDPADLLEVVSVRTGRVTYVCRPPVNPHCFRHSVLDVSVERVAPTQADTDE